ncbi:MULTISPECIES: TerC family protein [unclassified Planococcus (in: firmicutes)]|uniref:TerC family protein n=1 Tax=unclassified Planococcus (in: firmicutes) TaxID=2662419 RepID=UPI001F4716AD|nr:MULTISPECIES: TerC family protein [unclassified Planococcus (in: firmicutes)]UJF25908.1 TerC family protein [Planococcus sp. 107-1]GKW45052.1 membrane protein [Planococcus sp. NCCP-2050]
MEAVLLEYAWVLLVLVGLEGLLAADNAVVMAVMVKHLPKEQQKKALFYGLVGAFVFRFAALFMITLLVNIWQIQALGAAYLLFISVKSIYDQRKGDSDQILDDKGEKVEKKGSGFWMTVLKVELADIAFAIDSMLAAVALAVTLPHLDLFGVEEIGGINSGQFTVMLLGGLIGVIIMRFAAHKFVQLLEKYPQLETGAFVIVGWVGVKLLVMTLAHENVGILPHDFPHSTPWTLTFWTVLIGIVVVSAVLGVRKSKQENV